MKEYMIHCDAYSLRVAVAEDADLTDLVKVKLLELNGMDSVVEGWMYNWIAIN